MHAIRPKPNKGHIDTSLITAIAWKVAIRNSSCCDCSVNCKCQYWHAPWFSP